MTRLGQVFMWPNSFALVTESLKPPRRRGSSAPAGGRKTGEDDLLVHTLCVWEDSGGVFWPVERSEDCVARWESALRRIA